MASFQQGQRVRFTRESLGVVDPDSARAAFLDWHVGTEDVGTYERPDHRADFEGWHIVTVERDGQIFIVPVHASMIELAEGS
jgi:hypothetical protein